MPDIGTLIQDGGWPLITALLIWAVVALWRAWREESKGRTQDAKEHSTALLEGIRALDRAREAQRGGGS